MTLSLLDETKNLERRSFFAYERLAAVDLNDQESFHRELRWLHNRSLHQPGIGNGYKVTGNKGDRNVTIGPGYALDAYGREIILVREVTEPIPPVAGSSSLDGLPAFYYLAVSYPDDSRLDTTETRQGLFGSLGAVRQAERPLLCWVELELDPETKSILVPKDSKLRQQVNTGMVLVLALIEVFQCRLNRDISAKQLAVRRDARPPRLPFIASAVVKNPNWFVEPIDNTTPPSTFSNVMMAFIRLRAVVETKNAAVFVAIPRYLVRISTASGMQALPTDPESKTPPPPPTPVAEKIYAEPQVEVLLDENLTDHTKFTIAVTLILFIPNDETFKAAQRTYFPKASDSAGGTARSALANHLSKYWSIVWAGIEG